MAEQLQEVVQQLIDHLSDVLATTSGQVVRPLPAVGSGPVDWQVPITVGGDIEVRMTLGMNAVAGQRLTSVVLMSEGEPSDGEVVDTLKEIVTQAAAAYVNQGPGGISLIVGLPVRETATPPSGAWQHDLVMDGDEPPRIAVWSGRDASPSRSLDAGTVDTPSQPLSPRAPDQIGGTGGGFPHGPRNLDVVLDLELPITVRFGATRMTLDALSRLGPGSLIDLERLPDDPVDLLVNGRLVARGDVVVVSGCYGVRVRDVVSAADRLRSLEG